VANPDQELYLIEGRTYNFDQKYARHTRKHAWKFGDLRRDCCRRNNPEALLNERSAFSNV